MKRRLYFGPADRDRGLTRALAARIGGGPISPTLRLPPFVLSVTPSLGVDSGGTAVTVSGGNFLPGATVTFGGTPATAVTVNGPGSITCTTPAHAAGAVTVAVQNPDGQIGTLINGFTFFLLIIPDDAETVAHLHVRGGVVSDTKAGVGFWSEFGVVDENPPTLLGAPFTNGKSPESIGPFTASNFYRTASSVVNPPGPFFATVVGLVGTSNAFVLAAEASAVSGYSAFIRTAGTASGSFSGSGFQSGANTVNTSGVAGTPFVFSTGVSGNLFLVKLNLGAVVTVNPGFPIYVPGALGAWVGGGPQGQPLAGLGRIVEVRITRTAPDAATLDALHTQILTA